MLSIDFTFLWVLINLIVLYLFLNHFLFKRVGKFMEERSEKIRLEMEQAEQAKEEAQKLIVEQKAILGAASADAADIISQAREKSVREGDAIVERSKGDAERLMLDAHREIDLERKRMESGMRDEIASLAIAAASKVVEANMDSEKNRKLVDELLEKEGVA